MTHFDASVFPTDMKMQQLCAIPVAASPTSLSSVGGLTKQTNGKTPRHLQPVVSIHASNNFNGLSLNRSRNNLKKLKGRPVVRTLTKRSCLQQHEREAHASANGLRGKLSDFVKSPIYSKYIQGTVFVGVLAAVDAGYSGDWSRIGAISQQDEAALQKLLPLLAAFHAFSAVISGIVASRNGRPIVWPVTKAALVGGLAMFEQLLQLPDE